jgi:VCBS repeat-containing protein
LINDTDPDGDTLNIISVSPTSAFGAAVTLNEEGVVSYNPRDAALLDSLSEGQEILDTFVYTVSDGNGGTDTGIITLRVVGLNDEPVAADDAFNATTTAALSIPRTDLLANDTDVDQQDVLIVSGFVAVSAKGALITAADANTISYDPTGVAEFAALGVGESTTDTFTYTISDGHGGVSTATVTITVTRSNSVPVGVDDAYATNADVTLSVPAAGVLTNDTDPDAGDTLSVVAGGVTSTLGAAVTLNADGSFSYDGTGAGQLIALAAGQVVEDSFTYTLTDAAGAEATATVRITVTGVNNAPNAGADTGEVQEDETLTVLAGALFTNDADPDTGDTFAAVSENITSTLGAKVAITADGGYVYDPTESAQLQALKPGETIQDTFTYTIQDAAGLTATGLVTITVNGANDAPTAVNDIGEVNEDAELNVPANGLLANDTDPDATDVLKVVAGTITSQYGATVTLNEDGSYVYDPRNALTIRTLKQGETAVDTFQYTMRDEAGAESTATVSITVTGTAADTIAPTISVSSVTVAETDGATMIFTITLEHASFQTITVDYTTADGTATAGADYTALSGALTFNPQQLTQQIVVTVLNDTDVESPETLLLNLSNAVNTFNATASGTGTITDDDNQPPVAGADTGETDEDSVLTVADPLLTANDTDPDNHVPLVVVAEAVTSAQGAAVTINADGSYSYDPTAAAALQALGVGESIVDTFTYKVRDSLGAESVGTVSITVNGLNDAPTVVGDVFDANEDQVLTISAPGLLANDSDVDGDALQLTTLGTSNLGAIVVINQDGSFTYDPTNVAQIQQLAAGRRFRTSSSTPSAMETAARSKGW